MSGWSVYPVLVTGFKHQDARADQIITKDSNTIWRNTKPRSVAPNDYNIALTTTNDFLQCKLNRLITSNSFSLFLAVNPDSGVSCDVVAESTSGTDIVHFRLNNGSAYMSGPNRPGDVTSPLPPGEWSWLGIACFVDNAAGYYRMGVGSAWEMDVQGVDTRDGSTETVQQLNFHNLTNIDVDVEALVLCVPALRYSAGVDGGAAHPPTSGTLTQGASTANIIGTHPDDGVTDAGWILLDTISADFTVGGGAITTGTWAGVVDTELTRIPDDSDFIPEQKAEMGTVTADVSNTLTPSAGTTAYEVLDDVSTTDYATATTPGEGASMELTDIAGIGDPYFYAVTAVAQVDGAVITSVDVAIKETVSGDNVSTTHTPGAAYIGNTTATGTKPKTGDRLTQAELNSLRTLVTFN